MRTFLALICCWWLPAVLAMAQVRVEVSLDQEQFLTGEPVKVVVRVTNNSGRTLQFGKDNTWLEFMIEKANGGVVSKLSEVPVTGEFTLETSQVATKRLDLTPSFDIAVPGRYRMAATVKVPQWDQNFSSPAASFDVINGVRLWEQEVGVTLSGSDPKAAPEVRKYTVMRANFLKHIRIYVRISDASDTRVYRVVPLGQMVSFNTPEAQVDRDCSLHLLNQCQARSFMYTVVNPEGFLLKREFYNYTATRPKLKADDKGRILVYGGLRQLTPQDWPVAPTIDTNTAPMAPTNPAPIIDGKKP